MFIKKCKKIKAKHRLVRTPNDSEMAFIKVLLIIQIAAFPLPLEIDHDYTNVNFIFIELSLTILGAFQRTTSNSIARGSEQSL